MNGHTAFAIRGVILLLAVAGLGAWLVLGHGSQAERAGGLGQRRRQPLRVHGLGGCSLAKMSSPAT